MSVEIVTLGCRLNTSESEVIRFEAERAGLTDTVIINSCAVTNEAVAQARQSIRRLKRERPQLRIVVTGCAAQTQPEMFADMPEVDRVVGNDDKMRGETWRNAREALGAVPGFAIASSEKIAVSDIMAVRQMAPHLLEGFQSGLPRVFVQVQNGCDHRCTFCIIPFGRGNSRSVPMGAVISQVRALVERGHSEIVLTGVDLTSYGADLPGTPKLGQLTRHILGHVPELKRLRISSVDSIEVDRDLFEVIATDERLMPHLHLSLQSGDDLVLKRMKRRHSRSDAIAFISRSAPISSPAFRPRLRKCSRARWTWSASATSPSCMYFPIQRAPVRRRRECRRLMVRRSKSAPGDCGPPARRPCKSGWLRKSAGRARF
jgi:threonylcarbamoyladenosine tRNA methylthiotransferase MtaB